MMAAELDHAWLSLGWRAENSNVKFRPAEPDAIRRGTARRRCTLQHLVGIHDVHHFLKTRGTQRRSEERKRGVLLGGVHVAQLQAIAFGGAILKYAETAL